MNTDPFDLDRVVAAQDPVYAQVVGELRQGRKRSHWMWFVFPQLAALGMSATAKHYGIRSLEEARAYLERPVLGGRLRECCGLILEIKDRSAHEIFGSPDDLKLRSSLTLFALAAPGESLFAECLQRYCAGVPDEATVDLCRLASRP